MKYSVLLIFAFLISGISQVLSQEVSVLSKALELEKNTVEALALYPEKERTAILEAATQPQVLVYMQHIRGQTEDQFVALIAAHPQEVQSVLFNLTRFPELISEIVQSGKQKTEQEMNHLLQEYPEELASHAKKANSSYFSYLQDIHLLSEQAQEAFKALLESYSPSIQSAYNVILNMPDVVDILIQNMTLTVLLGDLYLRFPEQLNDELNELSLQLAEQNLKDLQAWKAYLQENPEALSEFQSATEAFVESHQYDDQYYDFEEHTSQPVETRIIVHHTYRPYSYWFGHPWWYTYNVWHPYPWWYYSGFYYGPGNVIVFVHMPSPYFFRWYLYRYHHFYHYPRFTGHIFNYYYGPRRGTVVHSAVGNWLNEHQDEIPNRWLADAETRPSRIVEFGKFKNEFDQLVRESSGRTISERDFLRENPERFPQLNAIVQDEIRTREEPVRGIEPPVQTPERREPAVPLQRTPAERQPELPPRRVSPPREVAPPTESQRTLDRARDFHRQTWERTNPQTPRIRTPQPAPPVRRQAPSTQERTSPEIRRGGG